MKGTQLTYWLSQNQLRSIINQGQNIKQQTSIISINKKLNHSNKLTRQTNQTYTKIHKMFKKRTAAQPPKDNNNSTVINKRPINQGIDLRKDIQQMESVISEKKYRQRGQKIQQKYEDNNEYQKEDYQHQGKKLQHSLFKTKKINKFTSHILAKLPTITAQPINNPLPYLKPLPIPAESIQKPTINPQQSNELVRPILSNYGLLDKSHFKSSDQVNTIQVTKTNNHQQALMDYYVKKKMQQISKSNTIANEKAQGKKTRQPQAWQQVLQIQKQYLTQQEKIKEYSMQEIQRKLQKLAHDSIKTEIQKRSIYLKDLLQNEHERMEYASKKQLKMVKQDKERIQRELNSKYKDSGRRHFVQSIKNSVL